MISAREILSSSDGGGDRIAGGCGGSGSFKGGSSSWSAYASSSGGDDELFTGGAMGSSSNNNGLPPTVEEDRRHLVEASIVRVMKARKRLSHNDLVAEITRQLSHRFVPVPQVGIVTSFHVILTLLTVLTHCIHR